MDEDMKSHDEIGSVSITPLEVMKNQARDMWLNITFKNKVAG